MTRTYDIDEIINAKTAAAAHLTEAAYEELDAAIAYANEHGNSIESGEQMFTDAGTSDWTWIDMATYPEEDIEETCSAMISDEANQGYYCYTGRLGA